MDISGVKPEDLVCTDKEILDLASQMVTAFIQEIQDASISQSRVLVKNQSKFFSKASEILEVMLEQKKPELTVH